MSRRLQIAIVGAGISGLTLASLLVNSRVADRIQLRVIDAGERPTFDGAADVGLRVSAIASGSVDILATAGAWSRVHASRVSPYTGMRVWDEDDDADSLTALRFDAAEFALPQLGFIVENTLLRYALLEVLEKTDARIDFNTRLDALPDADLLVGADGARSFVRQQAGIGSSEWPYRQTALVTHLQTTLPHGGIARQRFLRSGPLGMLPLGDGRISVVWSATSDIAAAAREADDEELSEMLTVASDAVLGDLHVAAQRGAFPLTARHAERYVNAGLALVGDAAHAIHPLAGQGANLGLQDVATLTEVICTAIVNGEHPGDRPVLRRYERARKGANLTMLHFMTGLNRLFATDSGLAGELRSAGMRMFNRSGPIRERAVKVALGVE